MEYFDSKVKELTVKLPTQRGNPLFILQEALRRCGQKDADGPTFKLREITDLKTIQLVRDLGHSSVHGHNTLDAVAIQLAITGVYKALGHIIIILNN